MALSAATEAAIYVRPPSASVTEQVAGELSAGVSKLDVFTTRVGDISFGLHAKYPLWRPLTGRWLPAPRVDGVGFSFQVDGVPEIIGYGTTVAKALSDFSEQFHTRLQQLVVMRPFEMDELERSRWDALCELVDIESYRLSLPLHTIEYGKVLANQPRRWMVQWEASRSPTSVDLETFPDDFASYRVGQPFMAIVIREQRTMGIERVLRVTKVSLPATRSRAEDDEFAASLPSSRDARKVSLE